jgi:ribosomal protein S18 acetylase RimI-like enzyme
MIAMIEYLLNTASEAEMAKHLLYCDADFIPPLSNRVDINNYAKKLASRATKFEAWSDDRLVGLVAAYCNDQESRIAYITSVSVLREWMGQGIAANLLKQCITHAKDSGMQQICLEVASNNQPAIALYEKNGFVAGQTNTPFVNMNLYLKSGGEHG